jgi:RNA polymerase sigma-70 factor (ECF subfamily)
MSREAHRYFSIKTRDSRCRDARLLIVVHPMNSPDQAGEDEEKDSLRRDDQTSLAPERRWELFVESRDRFTRFALHLVGNVEDAQDLVQEVGIRVLRHPTGPRDEACFQAWCKGLLRNSAADYRRTAVRRPIELVGSGIDDFGARVTPVDPMLAVERRTKLSKHLGDLDSGSQQVLVRRYVLGQTAAEIASDTNTSAAGVRMKLKRLRSRLKRLLPKLAGLASVLPLDPTVI